MTVLEKIKRCVSLVWDFQEIYGEEDIEDFCSNELCKYSQHDEIMEYFKHIEELEKENAELKERVDNLYNSDCWASEQLTKAKEIIKNLLSAYTSYADDFDDRDNEIVEEAEQSLSEVKK